MNSASCPTRSLSPSRIRHSSSCRSASADARLARKPAPSAAPNRKEDREGKYSSHRCGDSSAEWYNQRGAEVRAARDAFGFACQHKEPRHALSSDNRDPGGHRSFLRLFRCAPISRRALACGLRRLAVAVKVGQFPTCRLRSHSLLASANLNRCVTASRVEWRPPGVPGRQVNAQLIVCVPAAQACGKEGSVDLTSGRSKVPTRVTVKGTVASSFCSPIFVCA